MPGREEYTFGGAMARMAVPWMCHPDSLPQKDMLPSCKTGGQHEASSWHPLQGLASATEWGPFTQSPTLHSYLHLVVSKGVCGGGRGRMKGQHMSHTGVKGCKQIIFGDFRTAEVLIGLCHRRLISFHQ